MNAYELTLIIKENKEEILEKIKNLIKDLKGKITSEEKWGKKDFFYPIKKLKNGYYFLWQIEMAKDKIQEFKKKLDLDETILRYLLLVKDK